MSRDAGHASGGRRLDDGAAAAADAARLAVAPLVRDGGQARFIASEPPQRTSTPHASMEWLHGHLREPSTLDAIARQSAMSVRTLARRFQERTGTLPLQWLRTARVRRAQPLPQTTALSVERIATEAGFGLASAFRERFVRIVGTTPKRYRQAFRLQAVVRRRGTGRGRA
ncbi:helix-turn-helix domain-containing protein [Burkholderia pseudomallei]|uniref:helix-turn-helix domain-containing protein n=1 Tax=Burkholderia pseudomallei TaxID=28450 RepID=UPI003F65954E